MKTYIVRLGKVDDFGMRYVRNARSQGKRFGSTHQVVAAFTFQAPSLHEAKNWMPKNVKQKIESAYRSTGANTYWVEEAGSTYFGHPTF